MLHTFQVTESVRGTYLAARGEFPTGLLYLVQDWGRESDTPVEYEDTRIKAKTQRRLVYSIPRKSALSEQRGC